MVAVFCSSNNLSSNCNIFGSEKGGPRYGWRNVLLEKRSKEKYRQGSVSMKSVHHRYWEELKVLQVTLGQDFRTQG